MVSDEQLVREWGMVLAYVAYVLVICDHLILL